MNDDPRPVLFGHFVALLLAIAVAGVWYRADLYPDQIPQTRAELFEAIASAIVIVTNILLLVVFLTAARRRSRLAAGQTTVRQINTAEHLSQVYINLHGSSVVSVVAFICLTIVVTQRPPVTVLPPTPSDRSPTQAAPAPPSAIPPPEVTHTPRNTPISPDEPGLLIITAEGYGRANEKAITPAHRENSALDAAKITGDAKLAEELVGREIQLLKESEGAEITEDTVRQIVNTWMPGTEIVGQKYDDTTGEAFVTVRLTITEAEREELRQRFQQSK